MIFWEETKEETGHFETFYRRSGNFIFDFGRWIWFQQRGDFQLGACATTYEHPEFWAGVIDVLAEQKQAGGRERRKLHEASFVRWNYFGTPTPEQVTAWEVSTGKSRVWNAGFIKVAVARVNLRQGEPKELRALGLHKAPAWFDPVVSAWGS